MTAPSPIDATPPSRNGLSALSQSPTWAVSVLMLFYAFSFLDRQILTLMVAPIRTDLLINDFQFSLLQGFAFAAFYAIFGLPAGWAADRWSRRTLIFWGFVAWSMATASCALAQNFEMMFISRLFVGAGEAALLPAAYSILSDRVPPHKLAFNLSLFAIGAPIGAGLSIVVGSVILQSMPESGVVAPGLGALAPWQATFLLVGLIGVPLALLSFSFKEPGRRTPNTGRAASWGDVLATLRNGKRFYTGHFIGFSLMSLSSYGALIWMPAFLNRKFDMQGAEVGLSLAFITAVPTIAGSMVLGWAVDRWSHAGRRDAHLRFFAVIAVVQALLITAAMFAPSKMLCLGLFAISQFGASFAGVAAAALQIMTPSEHRGRVTAIYLLVFNLIGYGCGATIVAAFTDFLFRDDVQVGASIALTCMIFMPLASIMLLWAGPAMRRRLDAASPEG